MSFGMSSYDQHFSELKNMDPQLASALSTKLKLRLVVFLHFDKHAVENAQKAMLCMIPICQFGFLTPKLMLILSETTRPAV